MKILLRIRSARHTGQGRHTGFGLQSLSNTNGNSAFSLGGPPTLLAPNGQVAIL
jgi:hypothetical protein